MSDFKMRVFKQVPRIVFGQNSLERLPEVFPSTEPSLPIVFVVDSVHEKTGILGRLKGLFPGRYYLMDTSKEPHIRQVDELVATIRKDSPIKPEVIIGVGGGCAMDLAKATAVMLNNPGSAADYQGWDLVKHPAVYKIGIPTIAGSGSEASRTAVFYNKDKKFGINSNYSMFDAIVLDPTLVKSVPTEQRFWTAMDCYIHSVEALSGTLINELARAYGKEGLELSRKYFMNNGSDEELMVASYMGGASIVNSEVGICHALSYGLSLELGFRHGIANCIAFNVLEEYYHSFVDEFRTMLKSQNIELPRNVCKSVTEEQFQRMIEMTYRMEKPLTNALGPKWKSILTPDKITALYKRM